MAFSIILGGALGRMGRAVAERAADGDFAIACGVDVAYQDQTAAFPLVRDYAQAGPYAADALVDFSRPEGLPELLALCLAKRLPAVLCATGYTDTAREAIREAGRSIPVLQSGNMSLGVNVLQGLVRQAAKALGPDFDIEIVETHHNRKADAPSGTALMLAEAARQGSEAALLPVFGRHGGNAKREPGELGIHAVRGGTVVGVHEVGFFGPSEYLTLTHTAEDRSLFVSGALAAARFLRGREAGLYTMQDVVNELMR